MRKYFKYIFIFIISLLFSIFVPIDLDEIWNYGFIHSIYNGLIPYKDFNMVITPFFQFLFGIPFLLFKSNIIVVLIENSLLITGIFYLLERIIGKNSYLVILILFFYFPLHYLSYNTFILFLLLLIIYLEEKNYNNKDYLIGFIIGLSILTKHSIGLFFIIPSIYLFIKNKDFKMIRDRIIGCLVPCFIFLFYLIYNDCLYNFLDLCLFGLFDFGKSNFTGSIINIILFIITFIINIIFIIRAKNKLFSLYTLMFSMMVIPLFDTYHTYFYIYMVIIYIMSFINLDKIKINFKLFMYMVCSLLLISVIYLNTGFNFKNYPNDLNHFNYLYIPDYYVKFSHDFTKHINKYKDNKIIFFSEDSYYYKILWDKDINYYDLINTGNWGYNGSNKLYKSLLKEKNGIFIVDDESFTGTKQTDKIVLKFLKEHGDFIEKYGEFKIYKYKE